MLVKKWGMIEKHFVLVWQRRREENGFMNKKGWLEKLYTTIGIACVMLLCLYVGAEFEQTMQQRDENLQTVTEIAVVNMDTGIKREGKKLNYAAGLVQFPDTNFTYTSLEAAREGIANGSYAAYIIIPEGFSECAVSIESEPENIQMQYAINEKLREDIYNRIVGNIHDFEIMLNTNLSYMYISAILTEFHEGQDAAETIMKNDKAEMELILGIDAETLLAKPEMADAEYPENNLEYTDLSEEQRKNSEYLKQIGDYQTESIERGKTEFEKVKEADTTLKNSFSAISETLSGIEITKDEEGNTVYQEGLDNVTKLIEEYLQIFMEERKAVMVQAGWGLNEAGEETVSDNEILYGEIDRTVQEHAQTYNQKLSDAKKEIEEAVAKVRIETVSGNTVSGNTIIGLEEVKAAVDAIPEFTYDIRTMDEGILAKWQWDIVNAMKDMTEPDVEEWHIAFQEGVIDKVLEEAQKEDKQLLQQRKTAAEEMNKYESALGEYDPFQYMETEKLNGYITELNENIFDMEEEINKSTMEKEEYVTSVYGAVLTNEAAWLENMEDAYTATSNNVEGMVSGLQQNKTVMNETNKDLLLEFSSQLPYTRLGKVEYTRMYDFVTHPLETEDLSTDKAKILHNRNYEPFIFGILGAMILWLAAGGIYHIYSAVREEKTQDK